MPATVQSILAAPQINRRGDYVEHPQWRAVAAINALRDRGRYQALLSDTAPVGVEGVGYANGAMGDYNLGYDAVRLADRGYTTASRDKPVTISQPELLNTAAHELTHALQGPERRAPSIKALRESPNTMFGGGMTFFPDEMEKGANQWGTMVRSSRENYGPGELGARFASELGYGEEPRSEVVQQAYDKWPGMSMVYAQKNMQPNRPFPKHYKGEPEWTKDERKQFEKTGERPYYSDRELVEIQQARINALRARQ